MVKLQLLRKNPHQKVKLLVVQLPVSHHCRHQQNCWTGALRWLVATRALNWPTGQHRGAMVSPFVPLSIISGQTWCELSSDVSFSLIIFTFSLVLPVAVFDTYYDIYLYLHAVLMCTVWGRFMGRWWGSVPPDDRMHGFSINKCLLTGPQLMTNWHSVRSILWCLKSTEISVSVVAVPCILLGELITLSQST